MSTPWKCKFLGNHNLPNHLVLFSKNLILCYAKRYSMKSSTLCVQISIISREPQVEWRVPLCSWPFDFSWSIFIMWTSTRIQRQARWRSGLARFLPVAAAPWTVVIRKLVGGYSFLSGSSKAMKQLSGVIFQLPEASSRCFFLRLTSIDAQA